MASHPPAGWLGLICMMVSEFMSNKRVSFNKQDLFKSHFVSYLLMFHWQEQVKWPTQIQGDGEINLIFCGRICSTRFQGYECRERKNLTILTVYHREVAESFLMKILGKKRLFFSMSTCLEMKQMRGFCFQGLVTLNSLVI